MSIPAPKPSSGLNALQLLLSPRPTRTNYTKQSTIPGIYNSCTATISKEAPYDYVYEEHFVSSHPKAQGGKAQSQSGPPPHIHLYQAEYFKVVEGTLGVEINGKDHFFTPESEEAIVPKMSRHRFWPEKGGAETGNMRVRIRVDAYPGGFDERFIRNAFCYAADCERQGMQVNLLQMILFLYAHDMVVAMPFPVPVLRFIHWVLGYGVAYWILGYKASYPEYYDESINGPAAMSGVGKEDKKEL